MGKKRVYVESSVISYLTSRPANDGLKRIHQRLTAVWWKRRSDWDCIVTTTVLEEISRGDPTAAALRREKARLLTEVPVPAEIDELADVLLARKLVPQTVVADAYHLAAAAFHQAHYLLTWNQKHLDNIDIRSRIEALIKGWGLTPAKVITPERLLEESP